MRTFQFLTLAALAGLLVVAACTQQNDPEPAPQQDYVAQLRAKIESGELLQGYRQKAASPYHSNNPQDSAGIIHNLIVDEALAKVDSVTFDSAWIVATDYGKTALGLPGDDEFSLSDMKDLYFDNEDSLLDASGYIDTLMFKPMRGVFSDEFVDLVQLYTYEIDRKDDGDSTILFSKAVEDDVIANNTSLSSFEKDAFLSYTSVRRHSNHLWYVEKPVPGVTAAVNADGIDAEFFNIILHAMLSLNPHSPGSKESDNWIYGSANVAINYCPVCSAIWEALFP